LLERYVESHIRLKRKSEIRKGRRRPGPTAKMGPP
jgi:hypothetical protein